jgi:hypothetical protein
MRHTLLLTFRLLDFQFHYIYLTNYKLHLRRQRNSRSAVTAISAGPSSLGCVRAAYGRARFIKIVSSARQGWLTGDNLGTLGQPREAQPQCSLVGQLPNFTFNLGGRRRLYRGFDTRLGQYKTHAIFLRKRQQLFGVRGGVSVVPLWTSTGGVKHRASAWDTQLQSAGHFFGGWASLYRLGTQQLCVDLWAQS